MDVFSDSINLMPRELAVLRELRKAHGWESVSDLSISLRGVESLTPGTVARTARDLVRQVLAEHRVHAGRTEYRVTPDGALVADRYEPGMKLADWKTDDPSPANPMITEPAVAGRSWVFRYPRPRRMTWPSIMRTGWDAPHKTYPDKLITPHTITITVRQEGSGPPELNNISVTGVWGGTSVAVERMKIHHDAKPGHKLIIRPPGWVMELAADAVRRAAGEAGA